MDAPEDLTTAELGVKTASVASFVAISKAVNLVIGGLTFIVVARLLGASSYGIYTLAVSAAGLIGVLSNLSVNNYFNRQIPQLMAKKDKKGLGVVLGDGLLLLFLIGLVFAAIGVALAPYLVGYVFHGEATYILLDIALISVIFGALSGSLLAALISFGSGKFAAVSTLLNAASQAFVSLALVLLGFGPTGAVVGWVFGTIVAVVAGIYMLSRLSPITIRLGGFVDRIRPMVKFALPLTATAIANTFIANWAVVFLGFFFLPSVVGAYGVGSRIGTFIDVISGSIIIVLAPMFSRAAASKKLSKEMDVIHTHTLYFSFLLLLPVIIYLAIFANQIVLTILASTYANAAFYMALIALGTPFTFFWSYGQSVAIGLGDVMKVLKYYAVVTVVELALMAIVVPHFGATGTILSTYYVGLIVGDILFFGYMKSLAGFDPKKTTLPKLIPANLAMILLLYAITFLHARPIYELFIGLAAVLLAYPALIMLTRGIGKSELDLLHTVSKRMRMLGPILGAILNYAELFRW